MELRIDDCDLAICKTMGDTDGDILNCLDCSPKLKHDLKFKGFVISKPILTFYDFEKQQMVFKQKEVIEIAANRGQISDGYHTFDELYYHRMILFAVICRQNRNRSWKSWKHEDGSMYDDYFIVGVVTKEGDYTYHYHKDHWELFKVKELEYAPKWDGHKPEDVSRLLYIQRR